MKKDKTEKIREILQSAGLKNTLSRLAILEVLSELKQPETAQDIHKKLKKIDLVTLYRTLTTLEKSGVLRVVDVRKNAVHYELDTNHHHHIVCTDCDKIEDFENKEIEKVLEKIAKKSKQFSDIKNHSLELFGLCRNCA
jgi:Fur family ferric uptake transcriptional regulator